MKRSRVSVGRKVALLMTALPVMLIALGGVGMAAERVTDGWLHSSVAGGPRQTSSSVVTDGWLHSRIAGETRQTSNSVATDGWYHSEIGEQASASALAQRTTTDGWLASTVGESARAETASRIAAAEELAGSTDGWFHSVVGDAARAQQPIRVVSSPVQPRLPDMTLIVVLISTTLLAGMGGFFLRQRFAL